MAQDFDNHEIEYIQTNISLRKLAAKWNIPVNTVKSQSKTRNWMKQRLQFQAKLKTKTEEKATDEIAKWRAKSLVQLQKMQDRTFEAAHFGKFNDSKQALDGLLSVMKMKKDFIFESEQTAAPKINIHLPDGTHIQVDDGKAEDGDS